MLCQNLRLAQEINPYNGLTTARNASRVGQGSCMINTCATLSYLKPNAACAADRYGFKLVRLWSLCEGYIYDAQLLDAA